MSNKREREEEEKRYKFIFKSNDGSEKYFFCKRSQLNGYLASKFLIELTIYDNEDIVIPMNVSIKTIERLIDFLQILRMNDSNLILIMKGGKHPIIKNTYIHELKPFSNMIDFRDRSKIVSDLELLSIADFLDLEILSKFVLQKIAFHYDCLSAAEFQEMIRVQPTIESRELSNGYYVYDD